MLWSSNLVVLFYFNCFAFNSIPYPTSFFFRRGTHLRLDFEKQVSINIEIVSKSLSRYRRSILELTNSDFGLKVSLQVSTCQLFLLKF
jgi:hypothetical protein